MIIVDQILGLLSMLGVYYSAEQYLFMTKLQCMLWTSADVVMVIYLTRIANLARKQLGKSLHVMPYVVLGITMLFVPFVPIAESGSLIFKLEMLITVPHFILLIYVLAVNYMVLPEFVQGLL